MKDDILQQQPTWRYCRVRQGEKRPYPANWQNTPLLLEQVDSDSIGLLLGVPGNGVCAIDFDGPSSFAWLEQQGIDFAQLPLTPTWSSGRTGRCQMAYSVVGEAWEYLTTKKIPTGPGEGFEFRWTGCQSVLPPSVHPDTGRRYQWEIAADHKMQELPLSLLELWLTCCENTVKNTNFLGQEKTPSFYTNTSVDTTQLLKSIKNRYFSLRYDEWRNLTWAVATVLGPTLAITEMKQYYPEQRRGEYQQLLRHWTPSRSPTAGTIYWMAGWIKDNPEPEYQPVTTGPSAARVFARWQQTYRI